MLVEGVRDDDPGIAPRETAGLLMWEMLGPAALHPDPRKIHGGIPSLTPDDVRLALAGLSEKPFLFGMAAFLGHRGSMERIEELLRWDVFCLAQQRGWATGKDRHGRPSGEFTDEDTNRLSTLASLLLFEVVSAKSRHDTYAHEVALPTGSATVLCPACRGRGSLSRMASDEACCQAAEGEVESLLELCDAITADVQPKLRAALAAQWQVAKRLRHAMQVMARDSLCDLCKGRGRFLLTNPKRASILGVSLRTWERIWNARYAEAFAIPSAWEGIAIGHVKRRLKHDA